MSVQVLINYAKKKVLINYVILDKQWFFWLVDVALIDLLGNSPLSHWSFLLKDGFVLQLSI